MKIKNSRYSIVASIIFISTFLYHCKEPDPEWILYNYGIKGHVYDELTNEPIARASIKIWVEEDYADEDTLYYLTDTNGIFLTEKLSIYQSIILEASKTPDYKTIIQEVYGFIEDNYLSVELSLEPIIHSYSVIPDTLDFRNDLSSLSLSILNTGTGQLDWQLFVNNNWITADADSGTVPEKEFEIINLQVDRSLLTQGYFSSSIDLISNAGDKIIPVYITKD